MHGLAMQYRSILSFILAHSPLNLISFCLIPHLYQPTKLRGYSVYPSVALVLQ